MADTDTNPIATLANIAPNPWPRDCKADPNDLDLLTPRGNGLLGSGPGPYGLQTQDSLVDPVANGPTSDPCEGSVVYFDTTMHETLRGLLLALQIDKGGSRNPSRQYAVLHQASEPFGAGGFYNQLRIVDRFGLKFLFGAIDDAEYESFPEQELSIPELITKFVQLEWSRYGSFTSRGTEKHLEGTAGGDGHYAQEGLSFGLMVESGYYQVYRVWSRAWLVHK